uniref:C2H2-type domain-containing protein n=1 Tax=Panagrolaimus sp. JU765 TaxID=591449 RepID=A0AC34Q3S2_9BILA
MEDVQMEDVELMSSDVCPNQDETDGADEYTIDSSTIPTKASTIPIEQVAARNRQIFEFLYKRDGPGSDKTVLKENTFDMNESIPVNGKPIHLSDVIDIGPIEEAKFVYASQQLTTEDHEFYSDVPPIWLNPHLSGRQTFMSKYIRAVSKCYRDGLYDYDDPNFDPMFSEPDRLIPLDEAVLREKEHKSRNGSVKKEIEKVDRERMPPPSMPAINSDVKFEPIHAPIRDDTTSEKKFPCNIDDCRKSYKNLQGLKNHVKNCHPGNSVPSRLSTTEESILASTLHNNGQKLGSTTPQPRSQTPQSTETLHNYPVATPPMTPQQPSSIPQTPVRYESITPQPQQQMMPQQQIIQVQPQNQSYPSHGQSQLQYVAVSMPMNVSSGTIYAQPIQVPQPIAIQQQNQQRIQVQQSYQQQQTQPSSQPMEQYQQIGSSQASSPMELGEESNANYSGTSRAQNTGIKLKCPNCSKTYKTQQNLAKHLKENHQQNTNEVDVTLTKRSNCYSQNSSQNRQEMVIMEQDTNNSGRPSPVTYVRQAPNQHVQIIEQDQQQQPQYGQQIVHYQVQQMPQQQTRQMMPMEMDNQQQTNYVTTSDTSEVMVVDQNQSQKTNEQPQQMIIQTSSGPVVKQIGSSGQQPLIRQISGNPRQQQMHLISPVHIIQQQPGQQMMTPGNDRVTFVVRQGQPMRPIGTPQLRPAQQIMNAPAGTTYVYQQTTGTPSGQVTKYYLNATPPRPNQGQEMDGNDYYSSPPQLTPQQTVPQRVRPQQTAYQNYRPRPGQSVRITQTPVTGAKNTSVRYTVQVPQGQAPTAFVTAGAPSGSVQYIRSPAQIGQNGVKFITSNQNVLRVPSQGVRQGQQMQSVQQYPVTIQGSPVPLTRPAGYQQRPQRVRISTPNQGLPRRPRPPNPTNVVQINSQPVRPSNPENSEQIQESNVQNEQ